MSVIKLNHLAVLNGLVFGVAMLEWLGPRKAVAVSLCAILGVIEFRLDMRLVRRCRLIALELILSTVDLKSGRNTR